MALEGVVLTGQRSLKLAGGDLNRHWLSSFPSPDLRRGLSRWVARAHKQSVAQEKILLQEELPLSVIWITDNQPAAVVGSGTAPAGGFCGLADLAA